MGRRHRSSAALARRASYRTTYADHVAVKEILVLDDLVPIVSTTAHQQTLPCYFPSVVHDQDQKYVPIPVTSEHTMPVTSVAVPVQIHVPASVLAAAEVPVHRHVHVRAATEDVELPVQKLEPGVPDTYSVDDSALCYLEPHEVSEMIAVSKLWGEIAVKLICGVADDLFGSESASSFSSATQEH